MIFGFDSKAVELCIRESMVFIGCEVEDYTKRVMVYFSLANGVMKFNSTKLEGNNDVLCVLSEVNRSKGGFVMNLLCYSGIQCILLASM